MSYRLRIESDLAPGGDHILAFEGESQVVWFQGNYQAYEADYKRRVGAEADRPHRIKFKKFEVGV